MRPGKGMGNVTQSHSRPHRDTVVALTQANDETADMVIRELQSRDVPVFWFDTAQFPLSLTVNDQTNESVVSILLLLSEKLPR